MVGLGMVANQLERTKKLLSKTDAPAILLTSAVYQEEVAPEKPLPPSRIEVDTTRKRTTDTDALKTLFSGGRVVVPHSETLSLGTAPTALQPDWFVWGRLGGAQSDISIKQAELLPKEAIKAYAAYSPEGSAVVVTNHSPRKVPLSVQIRLPRGVYKVECLTFMPAAQASISPTVQTVSEKEAGQDAPIALTARLDRFQGRDLSASAVVTKPTLLEPGAVCILRYTDQAREVAQAWKDTNLQVNTLAQTNGSAAKRIRRMLREGRLNINGLVGSRKNSVSKRLSALHQMLLATAQAQSVHANLLARRAVPETAGTNLMGAIERLTDSLSETSAVLLGLVPRITVEQTVANATTTARFRASKQNTAPDSAPSAPSEAVVTVGLTNGGGQSIRMVKVGMDVATLPSGVKCEPTDPAFFGTLKPGQTARATFKLRGDSVAECPPNRYVGDVSYLVPSAPAHLRPRSW